MGFLLTEINMKFVLNAALRLKAAEADVIAPATSFKEKNEKELDRQQQDRQKDENNSSDNATEVKDTATAARTPVNSRDDLPATDAMYASRIKTSAMLRLLSHRVRAGLAGPEDDQLTHQMTNSGSRLAAKSTNDVDDVPGMVDGFNTVGQEGDQLRASHRLRANGPTTSITDPVDYEEGLPTELEDQPNVVPTDVVLSDADPKLWNLAEQPVGGMG
jgi:hypothetical protein